MAVEISAIVSTYNAPDKLVRVLDAYLAQSLKPLELIVADDGSRDDTRQAVERFARAAPFPVRHVWHEDQGFRAAKIRNEATKVSVGEYIVFTDGDCIPHPKFLEDHRRHAERGFFVQGKRLLVAERVEPEFVFKGTAAAIGQSLRGGLSGIHRLLRLPWLVSTNTRTKGVRSCNLGVFREDLIAVNGYSEDFVGWGREDSELVVRLYKYGLKRKDPLFSAMVFHLWHPLQPRDDLARNDELLSASEGDQGFRCANGISKSEAL